MHASGWCGQLTGSPSPSSICTVSVADQMKLPRKIYKVFCRAAAAERDVNLSEWLNLCVRMNAATLVNQVECTVRLSAPPFPIGAAGLAETKAAQCDREGRGLSCRSAGAAVSAPLPAICMLSMDTCVQLYEYSRYEFSSKEASPAMPFFNAMVPGVCTISLLIRECLLPADGGAACHHATI